MGAITKSGCCFVRSVVVLLHIGLLTAVGFFFPWVATSEAVWTLFTICLKNSTIPNSNNYSLDDQFCGSLDSGDVGVPGHYKAIQVLFIILFILVILQLNAVCDNQCLDQGKRPAFICFVCIALSGVILGISYTTLTKDDFFQGEERRVGLSVTLVIVSIVVHFVLLISNFNYDNHRIQQEAEARRKPPAPKAKNDNTARTSGGDGNRGGRLHETGGGAREKESVSSRYKNSVAPAPLTHAGSDARPQRQRPRQSSEEPRGHEVQRYGTELATPKTESNRGVGDGALGDRAAFGNSTSGAYTSGESTSGDSTLDTTYATPNREVNRGFDNGAFNDRAFGGDSTSGDSISDDDSTLDTTFVDHAHMHDLDFTAREDLYREDLRSASRASALREARGESVANSYGELPLLDTMPTYTLPPSRGSRTPRRPPPSYESVARGEYLDMPAPPVVTVPLSYLSDNKAELNPNI